MKKGLNIVYYLLFISFIALAVIYFIRYFGYNPTYIDTIFNTIFIVIIVGLTINQIYRSFYMAEKKIDASIISILAVALSTFAILFILGVF